MTFAEIVGDLMDKPFRAGGTTDAGMDCIGLCWRVARAQGKAVPETFMGYSIHDPSYADLTGLEMLRTLVALFDAIGEPVDPGYAVAGDWVLVRSTQTGEHYPAVYGGNGNFVASYRDTGVKIFSLRGAAVELVRAVRVPDGRC